MISPLLTDLYQLTMAYGYWKLNMHEREAVFQLTFRNNPFRGSYALACGLATAVDFIQNWRLTPEDLHYLRQLKTQDDQPLFAPAFLEYLSELRLSVDVDAMLEGTVVFAQEPLLRVRGPLLQAQLLESTLLNILNFQTLIATKAARVCQAAQGDPVLEFGLRRAQGPDGAVSASRAAYIGGCVATSNVLAGKLYDIPVRGTHAHSWVSAFTDEMQAFTAYAEVMPHNCVLLVDTYDTLKGVEHAIAIGKILRAHGRELLGIRLDSGDLAVLSKKARALLDAAGFAATQIVASNALDEASITALKAANAPIAIWGVGTSLVTAFDQPALDGVYKLSALRDANGAWNYKIKLSEQAIKISNPGLHQVRRFYHQGKMLADVMYDLEHGIPSEPHLHLLDEPEVTRTIVSYDHYEDLLQPVIRNGHSVQEATTIHATRDKAQQAVQQFVAAYPTSNYTVGLESGLHQLKQQMISELS